MPTKVEELLQDMRQKYAKSLDLMKKNDDPPEEPYKSKYEARKLLTDGIKCHLNDMRTMVPSVSSETNKSLSWTTRIDLIEATIHYELFRIANETEETCQAEECIKSALDCLRRGKIELDNINISHIALKILIHDGFIKTYFDRLDESISSLKEAEKIYKRFISSDHSTQYKDYVCHCIDLFNMDHENSENDLEDLIKSIECLHTTTVYYIAQVYQKLNLEDEAASYCLLTLQRQYLSLESFDTIEWATNAAVLCQYYFEKKNDYATARHMIAASLLLMSNLKMYDSSDHYFKREADINRIIVKYCLHLLEKGHSQFDEDGKRINTITPSKSDHEISHRLIESSDKLTQLEQLFPVNIPRSFEDARIIFLTGQSRINSATKYFTLNDHASDYCECIGDYSSLYSALQVYEVDVTRKFAMDKKRCKLLEQLLGEINVKYFLSYHRKFSFELAQIYQMMALSKVKEYRMDEILTRETQAATPENARALIQKASKVNRIIESSIEWYKKFTDLYLDAKTKKLPAKYDDENVRPLNVAIFSTAKLTSNKITYNTVDHVNNITAAENLYNQVVNYYEVNADQRHFIETEVNIIRDLLPFLAMRKSQIAAKIES